MCVCVCVCVHVCVHMCVCMCVYVREIQSHLSVVPGGNSIYVDQRDWYLGAVSACGFCSDSCQWLCVRYQLTRYCTVEVLQALSMYFNMHKKQNKVASGQNISCTYMKRSVNQKC